MSGFRRNSGPNRSPANDSHPSPKITWSIWKFRILTKKLETLYCSVLSYYQLHQKLGIKTSSIYIQLRMHNFHYVSNNLIHCWPIIYHLPLTHKQLQSASSPLQHILLIENFSRPLLANHRPNLPWKINHVIIITRISKWSLPCKHF